ncbi:MAG: PAS domain S-box protein [Acidobacteriota bacterium]
METKQKLANENELLELRRQLERRTQELQTSEARFRNIIARNADGIIIVDRQGVLRFINPAAEVLFSRKAEALMGTMFGFPLVAGEITELDILRTDGRIAVAEMRVVETNWEGEVAYLASLRDITERKRTEQRLQLLELAVQQANDAIIITSASRGHYDSKILFVNDAFTRITGYTKEEAIGKTIRILHGPNTDISVLERLDRSLAQGEIFYGEAINYCKDGREINLEWQVAPIRDENGMVEHFIAIQRDLTERKRIEEERTKLIREQAARAEAEAAGQRLALLAEASALLAASLNYNTTLSSVAGLAVPILGDWCIIDIIAEDGILRRLAVAHIDPSLAELLWQVERLYSLDPDAPYGPSKVIQTGQPEIIVEVSDLLLEAMAEDVKHTELLRQLGFSSYMCVPLIAHLRTLGSITFVMGQSQRRFTFEDVTLAEDLARRAALAIVNARLYREAQEANRIKDEFLATVSHELRTPLTAMLGWTRMLRIGKLDETKYQRALEAIERNARSQAQIIDDLLDVSRIITGKLRLEVRPISFATIIEAAIDSVRPAAEAKAIQLNTVFEMDVGLISGDPDRLQQVIWNLLSNAIKFTPERGRVDVQVKRVNTSMEVMINDTGIGISPDFLPYVFERFRQADGSITRTHSGLGLGLAIVRHLVELHGGTVEVASPGVGKGTSFKVVIPLTNVNREAIKDHSLNKVDTSMLEGLRILFVDDDIDTCEMVTIMLAQHSASVRTANSASEAFKLLQYWKPDVLISDIGMPDEDGYSLIRRVRTLKPEQGGQIPAIALTAYVRTEDQRRALLAGFQMHLAKPIEPTQLTVALVSLISAKERYESC